VFGISPESCSASPRNGVRLAQEYANQIWQSDMLFGPWVSRPGGGKQQVFLQAALDDANVFERSF